MFPAGRITGAFRRPLAAAAIAAAACITVVPVLPTGGMPQAQAESIDKCVTSTVSWGVRDSFRKYIKGKIAQGNWETDGNVSYDEGSGEFIFNGPFEPIENYDGTYVVPLGADSVIHFTGHHGKLDTKLSDFKIQVEGSTAQIVVDYTANLPEEMTHDAENNYVTEDDIALATIDLSSAPDFSGNDVDLSGDVMLTDTGNKIFLGQYEGENVDPITANVTLGDSCAPRPSGGSKAAGTSNDSGSNSGNSGSGSKSSSKKNDDPVLSALKDVNDYGTAINNLLTTTDKILGNADKIRSRFDHNGVSNTTTGAGPGGGAIGGATGTTGGGSVNRTSGTTGGATGTTGGGTGAGGTGGTGTAAQATSRAGGAGGGATGGGAAAGASTSGASSVCTADSSLGVTEANAAWGVKQSFQSYITGSIAKGSWELDGVSHSNGEFHFSGTSGAVDPKAGTGTILFPGTMFFSGHKGVLQLQISNIEIQWNGTSGSLVANVTSNDMEGNNTDFGRVAVADLSFSQLDVSESAAAGRATTSLTQAGSQAFAEFYPVGTELDPVSFTASLGGSASCADGQGSGASGGGVAGAGGNAAAAAALKSGGGTGNDAGTGAAKTGAKAGSANAAAKLAGKTEANKANSEGTGFDSPGSFKIKSAGVNSSDNAAAEGATSPFTTPILLILAAFVVAGATLSQFVSRNPNSR